MNEDNFDKKVEELKSYIRRVSNGEDMESVQADFKENFEHVPAKMIAQAEQRMMADGAKMEDIQKLCDIHSVLFHDMTNEERLERMKEEMEAHSTVYVEEEKIDNVSDEVSEKTLELKNTDGHPLNVLTIENDAIKSLVSSIKKKSSSEDLDNLKDDITNLTSIRQHYAKKDDLLFPLLMDKYDYPGPANVMWAVEDEIREELHSADNKDDLLNVLNRIEEMCYKEENILFPLCAENFSDDDWLAIGSEISSYGPCLVDKLPVWDNVIETNGNISVSDDVVTLPGGSLTLRQLREILNIIPMELTVIDENDINRFFDEDENKVFLRPKTALNRDMHSCHPPRVMKMVDKLLDDFKSGKSDSMHVLSFVDSKQILTNYYALRDDEGNYIGTLEAVLHIDGIADCIKNEVNGPVSAKKIFPN